ncbi:MAG: hypothetical protein IPK68_02940 [Bdellovibrionales bacterium]|nr:hypothetical protein [Bdellovibrionales bacterium]
MNKTMARMALRVPSITQLITSSHSKVQVECNKSEGGYGDRVPFSAMV